MAREDGEPTTAEGLAPQMTFADKLDLLFRTIYPAGGKPYTYEEVSTGIRELTGQEISGTAVFKLRQGKSLDPKKSTIEALAAFFEVPPAYFFDGQSAADIRDQLELLTVLRDTGVRGAQLRTFFELSPEAQDMVADMIVRTARLEQNKRLP